MAASARAGARVLVVNCVALNVGDAAILEGILAALHDAVPHGLDVRVSSDAAETARRLYPGIDFIPGLHALGPEGKKLGLAGLPQRLRRARLSFAVGVMQLAPALGRRLLDGRARRYADEVARADAVVATGGTYFVEHYGFRAKADELLLAEALGRPTFLYTQSAGPFRKPRHRRLLRRAFSRAARVFLRDEKSRGHLVDIGVPADRLEVRADAAFALARPAPRSAAAPRAVAISVREWKQFGARGAEAGLAAYRESVAATVRALRAGGARVVFVSTCQGVPEYWTDDSAFAARLVHDLLPDVDGVEVDTAFRTPDALLAHLGTFDLVIATRMHVAILALCAGTPVVPVAYEFKTTELFRSLGMGDLVEEIDAIAPASLTAKVERALAERDRLSAEIVGRLPALAADAAAPARHVAATLASRSARR